MSFEWTTYVEQIYFNRPRTAVQLKYQKLAGQQVLRTAA